MCTYAYKSYCSVAFYQVLKPQYCIATLIVVKTVWAMCTSNKIHSADCIMFCLCGILDEMLKLFNWAEVGVPNS